MEKLEGQEGEQGSGEDEQEGTITLGLLWYRHYAQYLINATLLYLSQPREVDICICTWRGTKPRLREVK